jgi:hypothetical protein
MKRNKASHGFEGVPTGGFEQANFELNGSPGAGNPVQVRFGEDAMMTEW